MGADNIPSKYGGYNVLPNGRLGAPPDSNGNILYWRIHKKLDNHSITVMEITYFNQDGYMVGVFTENCG